MQVWRPVFRQMPRTQREVPEVCVCTASATEEMGTRQENPWNLLSLGQLISLNKVEVEDQHLKLCSEFYVCP